MKLVLVTVMCMAVAGAVLASQEYASPVAQFSITWDGGEELGTITARGSRRPDGALQRFTVLAFGRTLELPDAVMAELAKIRFNGVLLSGEVGYPELGGKTAYLQFVAGFTSGVTSRVIVAVKENGEVQLLQHSSQR